MAMRLDFAMRGLFATPAATVEVPGLLFISPSWRLHQLRPYRGSALRMSITFNLSL